jgi:maltodextrin utilization protein YvdJ
LLSASFSLGSWLRYNALFIGLLGLVFVPVSSHYLIAETFGLITALDLA